LKELFVDTGTLAPTHAYRTPKTWTIYWAFVVVQMAFHTLLPGIYQKGTPLPHLEGKQLVCYCSGCGSFHNIIVVVAIGLYITAISRLYTLPDELGPIMTAAVVSGFLCSLFASFSAIARVARLCVTGNFIRDFSLDAKLRFHLFGLLNFTLSGP